MKSKLEINRIIDKNTFAAQKIILQKIDIWKTYVVFSDLWWLGVGLSIVPWFIWFFFRKKESSGRLLYSGFFVMVISLVLDVLGDQFGFWHYRYNVIPVLPTYFPWDCTLMPVTVMFLLQIKPNISPYIKAVFFALVTSYIGEPLFHWIHIYNPQKWNYTYSIPFQFIIYLISHYLSRSEKFTKLIVE